MEYAPTSHNRTVYAAPARCLNYDFKNEVFVLVHVETGRAPSLRVYDNVFHTGIKITCIFLQIINFLNIKY
jgi:hypothetical protein